MKRLKFDEVKPEMVVAAVGRHASHEGTVVAKGNHAFRISIIEWGRPTNEEAVIARSDVESGAMRVFDAMSL